MAIQLQKLTNGTVNKTTPTKPIWEGSGIFDVLIKAVNDNINIQYESNRITGADYAQVYLASLDTCIKESINFLLRQEATDAEAALKNAQAASYPAQAAADLAIKTAQVELYNKQKAGFDDNRRQKLFDSSVNAWALAYSSGILDKAVLPSFINNTDMSSLFSTLKV